jgi:serine protease Do
MVAGGSPAARAGLQAGDVITHIDGVSILTPAGARRFGSVVPGQRVRLTVRRNRQTLTRTMTLGGRPEVRAAAAVRASSPRPARAVERRPLRYTGKFDDVSVEVWSVGGPTVERIGDTMVISVGGTVVKLKVDPRAR